MSVTKYDEGRLMQVLVAPIVSEKATHGLSKPTLCCSRCCAMPASQRSRPLWK
jgi:hypothetical protein